MFPSEFKYEKDMDDLFLRHGLMMGRMIAGSKSGYCSMFPDHIVVFNANIITEKSGKIWHGDLDITIEEDKLKKVSSKLGEPLYILREHDARWGNENKTPKELIKHSVYKIDPDENNCC